jgi:carbamoyltransferase
MNILGISAFYHDSAASIVIDGKVVAAYQEERLSRKKHDPDFPKLAIERCLKDSGLMPSDIDHVIFYEKPFI